MRSVFFLLVLGQAASGAVPQSPLLAVSIEEAITHPGHNGKGALTRPLILIFSHWKDPTPDIEAYSLTGTIKATCTRVKSPSGQWNADIYYDFIAEPNRPVFSGTVKLRLRIQGAIVRGTYEGAFNGIPLKGSPGAGLVFEHWYPGTPQGLLLWLPQLKRPVRGIVFWGNGANLDNRYWALRQDFQAVAAANDLAVVGTGLMGLTMSSGEGDRLLEGLKTLAASSGHPELNTVPIVFMGHSNGGGMAFNFNQWLPSRVAGYVSSHGAGFYKDGSGSVLSNPGVLTAGEVDQKIAAVGIEADFAWLRLKGAHVSLVVEQGEDHGSGPGAIPFFLLTLQHIIDRRLPRGAQTLQPADDRDAWLADNSTWKDGITKIMPAAEVAWQPPPGMEIEFHDGHVDFKQLPECVRMSWLLDKDVAYIYRGIATYSNPLKLERAGGHGSAYLSSEPITLECTAFGDQHWKSIRVYDGARLLDEVSPAHPRLTIPAHQKPGAHASVLVGELPSGDLRTSLPVSWVVWP
jgi:dienelactone hydrolase